MTATNYTTDRKAEAAFLNKAISQGVVNPGSLSSLGFVYAYLSNLAGADLDILADDVAPGTFGASTATPSGAYVFPSSLLITTVAGIGTSTSTGSALYMTGTTTTGTTQSGIDSEMTFSAAATAAGYAGYFRVRTAAASYTMTNAYGIMVDNAAKGSGSTITNNYGVYIVSPTSGGTLNIGLYNAGTSALIGNVGIGATSNSAIALYIQTSGMSATTQYGLSSQTTFSTSATTAGYAGWFRVGTAASAFTMTNGYGVYVSDASKGSGSTITNLYGVYIEAPTQGGTTNIGLYNLGTTRFDGVVSVAAAPDTTTALKVGSTNVTSGVSQYGFASQPTFSTGATTAGYAGWFRVATPNSAFTMTSGYGIYVDTPSKGAASTITSAYGIYIKAQSAGGTANYGIFVEAPSGGSGENSSIKVNPGRIGLVVTGTTASTDTTKWGLYVSSSMAFDSTTTVSGTGLYLGATTQAAAFTMTNFYGAYIDATAKGAGSTITNRYGLYIVAPSDGATINTSAAIHQGVAAPATAGAVAAGSPIRMYSNGITIEATSDVPTHTRVKGSICINTGGSTTNNRIYINTDGAGTWTAFTTVA